MTARPSPTPPPPSMLNELGQLIRGVFAGPLRHFEIEEAHAPFGPCQLPYPLSKWRLKRWEHYALVTPNHLLSFALVDAAYQRTTWCQIVDRQAQTQFEHRRSGPLLPLEIPRDHHRQACRFTSRDYTIVVDHQLDGGHHDGHIAIRADGQRPRVRAKFLAREEATQPQPMVVMLPVGATQVYSHKAALPVSGMLQVGDISYPFESANATLIVDIHKAHYPYKMWWRWATGAGRLEDGRHFAFNLTKNPNRQDHRFNENGVWVDGQLHHLGAASFFYDRDLLKPWRLLSAGGALRANFTPEGARSEAIELGLVSTQFQQPYGRFDGTIRLEGKRQRFAAYGLCEHHQARW